MSIVHSFYPEGSWRRPVGLLCATLALTACTGRGPGNNEASPEPVPSATSSALDARATVLPPIEGDWYEADASGIVTAQLAEELVVQNGVLQDSNYGRLPEIYHQAILHAIDQPLVKLAAKEGTIKKIKIMPSDYDNGFFQPEDKSIELDISNGKDKPENRIYSDSRILDAVVGHEAMHSFSEDWLEVLEGTRKTKDPGLTEEVRDVKAACTDIRDSLFRDFIADHRRQLAAAFQTAGGDFHDMLRNKRLLKTYGPDKIDVYSNAMYLTAFMIKTDNPDIYDQLHYPGCSAPNLFSIPYGVSGVDAKKLGVYSEFTDKTRPISVLSGKQYVVQNSAFGCIRDGNAEAAALGIEHTIPGGHAFDNPTEAASSIVTVLSVKPDYIPTCLKGVTGERLDQLNAVIKSILSITEYTHPEVVDLLRKNPQARQVIDTYIP